MAGYAAEAAGRICVVARELHALPRGDRVLEIGANPYFLTILMREERPDRVLRPGGRLLVTTPNPARLRNLFRLATRKSIFDPISGYGPYGRHNREYAAAELSELIRGSGFRIERQRTVSSGVERFWRRPFAGLGYGDYHFVLARRGTAPASRVRPEWLYRSFPD